MHKGLIRFLIVVLTASLGIPPTTAHALHLATKFTQPQLTAPLFQNQALTAPVSGAVFALAYSKWATATVQAQAAAQDVAPAGQEFAYSAWEFLSQSLSTMGPWGWLILAGVSGLVAASILSDLGRMIRTRSPFHTVLRASGAALFVFVLGTAAWGFVAPSRVLPQRSAVQASPAPEKKEYVVEYPESNAFSARDILLPQVVEPSTTHEDILENTQENFPPNAVIPEPEIQASDDPAPAPKQPTAPRLPAKPEGWVQDFGLDADSLQGFVVTVTRPGRGEVPNVRFEWASGGRPSYVRSGNTYRIPENQLKSDTLRVIRTDGQNFKIEVRGEGIAKTGSRLENLFSGWSWRNASWEEPKLDQLTILETLNFLTKAGGEGMYRHQVLANSFSTAYLRQNSPTHISFTIVPTQAGKQLDWVLINFRAGAHARGYPIRITRSLKGIWDVEGIASPTGSGKGIADKMSLQPTQMNIDGRNPVQGITLTIRIKDLPGPLKDKDTDSIVMDMKVPLDTPSELIVQIEKMPKSKKAAKSLRSVALFLPFFVMSLFQNRPRAGLDRRNGSIIRAAA